MKKKRVWIIFAVSLVAALSATIYVMMNFLDAKTGFYADGGIKESIISVCIAAAAILMGVFSYTDSAESAYKPLNNAMTAAFAALTGVFILVQSVSSFTALDGSSAGIVAYRIFSVFGLPAGIAFLFAAYDFASGTEKLRKHPVFALFPSIWGCMYLIMLFITYAAVVNSFSGIYNTCTAALLLLFMFSQAKFITGIENEKSGRRIFTFGIPAAFFALTVGISSCIVYFSGKGTSDTLPIGLQMLNILMGIYIISFLAAQKRAGTQISSCEKQALAEEQKIDDVSPNVKQAEPVVIKNTDNRAGINDTNTENPSSDGSQNTDMMESYIKFLVAAYPSAEKFADSKKSPFFTA